MADDVKTKLEEMITESTIPVWLVGATQYKSKTEALQRILHRSLGNPSDLTMMRKNLSNPDYRNTVRAVFDMMDENDVMEKLKT
jgi:hypothetical protein